MRRNDTHTICAPLLEIAISERTLRSLSETTVARYRGWREQGREAPAIRIARVGDVYVVRDGRHRVAAALAAGHRFIEAEVRPIANWLRRLGRIARRLLGGGSPAAQTLGMRFFRKNASLAPRRSGFDSRRLHLPASVVSTASTRPLYGRGAGSTPAGGSFERP
jgi:hypothetical protein